MKKQKITEYKHDITQAQLDDWIATYNTGDPIPDHIREYGYALLQKQSDSLDQIIAALSSNKI